MLARWPLHPFDPRVSLTRATTSDEGKYQLTSLAPAEYRIFAIPGAARDKLELPNVLDRLLRSAKKVNLGPSGLQTIELEILEP